MSTEPTTSTWPRVVLRYLRHAPQWRNTYDLLLLIVMAVLLPVISLLPIPLLRVPFGLIAALFAPGYVLVAALFPRRTDLSGVARAALSFGFSAALLPVLALVLDALRLGIRPGPIVLSVSLWTLLLSGLALWRRRGMVTSGGAYVPPNVDPLRWWGGLGQPTKLIFAAAALVLGVTLTGAALSLLIPDPTARMTEFYALGADGLAENYPREVAPGQPVELQLGINNREGKLSRYRIEVRAAGVLLSQIDSIALEDGATWQGRLRYTLSDVGDDQPVNILLYADGTPMPYRQLELWINVRPRS